MAEIKFTGWVQDWTKTEAQHPDWAMRVGESHRKKNADGNWETVAYTYRTVKAAYDTVIDFRRFQTGDLVEVTGTEVTEVSERNGTKYNNLIVKALDVTVVPKKGAGPIDNEPF